MRHLPRFEGWLTGGLGTERVFYCQGGLIYRHWHPREGWTHVVDERLQEMMEVVQENMIRRQTTRKRHHNHGTKANKLKLEWIGQLGGYQCEL